MGKIWCMFVGYCKAIALACGGLNDLESDGYDLSSLTCRQQSGCEFKIGMMVCCFDAEYVSDLNVLHGMNFFPSTNTFLHPGIPSYSSV